MEEDTDLAKECLNRIQNMGRAEERLRELLRDEVFEMLSKHNPYWDSEHEVEAERLDFARRKFSGIQNDLWDIMAILTNEN